MDRDMERWWGDGDIKAKSRHVVTIADDLQIVVLAIILLIKAFASFFPSVRQHRAVEFSPGLSAEFMSDKNCGTTTINLVYHKSYNIKIHIL